MTIKELAAELQTKIDAHIEIFCKGQEKIKKMNAVIEETEKNLASIVAELEPVESLIYAQNPQLEKVFESLKRVYRNEDGLDKEINQ